MFKFSPPKIEQFKLLGISTILFKFIKNIEYLNGQSFKIDHPLDPKNKYLEHGSLEGPEHGIYQRGRASGYKEVTVELPDYFIALSEDDYSIQITPRINAHLYVSDSNKKCFRSSYSIE